MPIKDLSKQDAPKAEDLSVEQRANLMADGIFACSMASALGPNSKIVDGAATARYLKQLHEQAGTSDDPIEGILVEQLACAHQLVGQMHMLAAGGQPAEVAEVYLNAGIRLTGEVRRLALAIRDYRTPLTGRTTQVIHRVERAEQVNIAEGGQEVSYVTKKGGSRMTCSDNELDGNSNEKEGPIDFSDRVSFNEEPASCSSGEKEPTATG